MFRSLDFSGVSLSIVGFNQEPFLDLSWHEELGMKCVHINNVKRTQKPRISSHDSLSTFSLIACFFMKEHKEWFINKRNCKYLTRTS